ncbi:unnamed protein product, partial [Didymodactylos carnosus]
MGETNRMILTFYLLFATAMIDVVLARRRYYQLFVTNEDIQPDCIKLNISRQSTVLINKQFPGPEIRATIGDILIVNVYNQLINNEDLTIHFHGVLQKQTPQMDGVPYLTQLPIKSGENCSYVFRVQRIGTFFYHSHIGLQSMTAFGSLIFVDRSNDKIIRTRYNYTEERTLLLSDWWHNDRLHLEQGLLAVPFQWLGEPSAIIINGKTMFNSSCETVNGAGYSVINVERGHRYRIRVIGATTLSTLVFGIEKHKLLLIEVDGNYVEPLSVSYLEIASGQRYSFILDTTNQPIKNYYIQASIRWRLVKPNNGIAILRYKSASLVNKIFIANQTFSLPKETVEYLTNKLQPLTNFTNNYNGGKVPRKSNQEFVLAGGQAAFNGTGIQWVVNNNSLMLEKLSQPKSALEDVYSNNQLSFKTYVIKKGQVIDIILQNLVGAGGVCESHPWHTHGHMFWEISLWTFFNNAYFQYVNSTNHNKPCGWKKIRLIADNPGLWFVHCHIVPHMLM